MSVTHFADDDTLAYIANLEAELSRYREAEKALPEEPYSWMMIRWLEDGKTERPAHCRVVDATEYDKLRAHDAAVTAEREKMREDAERYRWLRNQNWTQRGLFVVSAGQRDVVRLGTNCPSLELLDDAIDAARKETP